MIEHASMLIDWFVEPLAKRSFRKHSGWYTRGFHRGAALRNRLMQVQTLDELRTTLADVDRDQPYPERAHLVKRGKMGGTQKVVLPEGFLENRFDPTPLDQSAESDASGG